MKPSIQKPRNFINPLLSRQSIDASSFDHFKTAIADYQKRLAEQVASKQSEPNIVTNTLKPLFDALGYSSQAHSQSGQSGIDLAIVKANKPAVIIEAKAPNSKDMISPSQLNKKSFHEAILYFMRERDNGNLGLFHIIITDFYNWFIFDAKDFDRLFWRNSIVKKIYDTHKNPALLGNSTSEFYQLLERELPNIKKDLFDPELIDCAHFNLQLTVTEKEHVALCKLLSPDCLLKEFNPNDANSLNKEFYNELLYILGLEEAKDGGKKLIGKAKNPQIGTLYENISNKLGQYQKNNDFEAVIKLIIIWVNRILFLKLLESQIVKWSGSEKFLNPKTLNQYDQLETLFFEILAKPTNKRTVRDYDNVPYLNSSLFEIHADEKTGITIATLADDLQIDYYSKTVAKDSNGQRKTGKVSTLPYLLEFLDAYDFANDSDDELVSSAKSLISASVLGLIFEKINGYKDGSFYTPSFITMYMARETITKTVIDKFNAAKGWECKTLTDLHNKINDLEEANRIIDSIKICDPAVGSGHFLVSSLNEMLRIKSELGVLVDETGKRIKDVSISVENDELIIKNDDGELFEYKKGSIEKTRIQRTIFKEKQKLIENCLFGVDINPNSVNICRLRLWIELLKNAYYKDDGALDTLPNIDINIKCGNSLISRFGLTDDLNSKTIKAEIQDYKDKVKHYKENIGSKQQVLQAIAVIKEKIQGNLKATHQATKKLNDALSQYVGKYSFDGLSSQLKLKAIDELKLLGKQTTFLDEATNQTDKAKFRKALDSARSIFEEMENGKVFQNAFEWRFEFPEVLNEAGEFVGFDVVIGNPPYGVKFSAIDKEFYKSKFQDIHERTPESYNYFVRQFSAISRDTGLCNLIIPSSFLNQAEFEKTRKLILNKYSPFVILNLGDDVFEDVATPTCIVGFDKQNKHTRTKYQDLTAIDRKQLSVALESSVNTIEVKQLLDNQSFSFVYKAYTTILDKCYNNTPTLKDVAEEVATGVSSGLDRAYVYLPKEVIEKNFEEKLLKNLVVGGEIHRFYTNPISGKKLIYITDENSIDDFPFIKQELVNYKQQLLKRREAANGKIEWYSLNWPRRKKLFEEPKILIRQTANKIMAAYDEDKWYCLKSGIIVQLPNASELSYKYLLGLLNSSLMNFLYHDLVNEDNRIFPEVKPIQLFKLPIKIAPKENQRLISEKVDAIIATKQNGTDTSQLEAELDAMIYALYDLSEDEIKLIEGTA